MPRSPRASNAPADGSGSLATNASDTPLGLIPAPTIVKPSSEIAIASELPRYLVETLHALSEFAGPRAQTLRADLAAEIDFALRAGRTQLDGLSADRSELAARFEQVTAILDELLPEPTGVPELGTDEPLQEFR